MESIVTVIVLTYNHRNYIRQTIESIIRQEFGYPFDILIHDDCSDDGTYDILLEYQNKYPNIIRIIRENERRFLIDGFNMMLFKYVSPNVHSKYIAYCDGDDYWCDNSKLRKQYIFMETHKDYSMCFHSAKTINEKNGKISNWYIDCDKDVSMEEFVNDKPGIYVPTSSIFVKSNVFNEYPEWRKAYPVEDVPLYMLAALRGKIHRMSDIMSVYRKFSLGSWSSQNIKNIERVLRFLNDNIKGIKAFDKETKYAYHDLVVKQVESCNFRISYLNKNFKEIFSKKNKKFVERLPKKERLSLKLQYRAPHLYNLVHRKKK